MKLSRYFFTIETQVKPQNISRAKLSRYVFTAKMLWPKLSRCDFTIGKLSRHGVNRYLKKIATSLSTGRANMCRARGRYPLNMKAQSVFAIMRNSINPRGERCIK